MIEELINTILLESLERLPTFSGNRNEDVIQWLKDMTDGLNYAKFTDEDKVLVIQTYIKGDARGWLLNNIDIQ